MTEDERAEIQRIRDNGGSADELLSKILVRNMTGRLDETLDEEAHALSVLNANAAAALKKVRERAAIANSNDPEILKCAAGQYAFAESLAGAMMFDCSASAIALTLVIVTMRYESLLKEWASLYVDRTPEFMEDDATTAEAKEAIVLAGAGFGLLSLALVVRRPAKRWYKKIRRRKGGIYLWRVDRHNGRGRVNGYVGMTNNFRYRAQQHMGISGRGTPGQPWSDLRAVEYRVIRLPWWLCWKWVMHPLETLVIFCTWPLYNDRKNRWNPRRVPKYLAVMQRKARNMQRGRIRWTGTTQTTSSTTRSYF